MYKRYSILFFCKQKTAYEMRISDCSSDVCSSDLAAVAGGGGDADRDLDVALAGAGIHAARFTQGGDHLRGIGEAVGELLRRLLAGTAAVRPLRVFARIAAVVARGVIIAVHLHRVLRGGFSGPARVRQIVVYG